MAKQQSDRTTLDLFADEKRPGRPKTNPLPRDLQLKINKRNQLKRDKEKGFRRVELKLDASTLDHLNQLAKAQQISRADLIQWLIKQHIDSCSAAGVQE
ncbi:LexA regulated protein [Pseudaeromonas paramecii]|uniref:LexA regulated protein n=1 Tax=Pseudaeromonas paramecii TaxID=2138166 RepID=A0ABP8Q6U5_9GAMM